MKAKDITNIACLTAAALVVFVIEAQLPPMGIPGVKPGLSNAVVLLAIGVVGRKKAFLVALIKTLLGNFFIGTPVSLIFSLSGGMSAFAVMCLTFSFFGEKKMWVTSVLGAMFHNAGQLAAAFFVMGTGAVFAYAPYLAISAVLTGVFTGFAAQFTYAGLSRSKRK